MRKKLTAIGMGRHFISQISYFTSYYLGNHGNEIGNNPSSRVWRESRINHHPLRLRRIKMDINVGSFSPVW